MAFSKTWKKNICAPVSGSSSSSFPWFVVWNVFFHRLVSAMARTLVNIGQIYGYTCLCERQQYKQLVVLFPEKSNGMAEENPELRAVVK